MSDNDSPNGFSIGVTSLDLTFISTVPQQCLCLLCNRLMKDPCHVTCCQSRYCQNCVEGMRVSSSSCVQCSSQEYAVHFDEQDRAVGKIIKLLYVYCPKKKPAVPGLERSRSWKIISAWVNWSLRTSQAVSI